MSGGNTQVMQQSGSFQLYYKLRLLWLAPHCSSLQSCCLYCNARPGFLGWRITFIFSVLVQFVVLCMVVVALHFLQVSNVILVRLHNVMCILCCCNLNIQSDRAGFFIFLILNCYLYCYSWLEVGGICYFNFKLLP